MRKWLRFVVLLKANLSNKCDAPEDTGVSYMEPQSRYIPIEAAGFWLENQSKTCQNDA